MLTDREAAKMRAEKVVSEVGGRLHVALHSGKTNVGQVLHTQGPVVVDEMLQQLCAICAGIDGAAESPLSEELANEVADRVSAFIVSTSRSIRGENVGALMRKFADLEARVRMGAAGTFKLAAYEAHKDKPRRATPTPVPKVDEDARAAFDKLPIHPDIRAVCAKQFADGHYREAILNAGIALTDYVKQRAGNPVDKQGKILDGTYLMQRVFGGSTPILKVNTLQTQADLDEQAGMQWLFSGATLGLRNPRAHSLDPDTAEYAVEAIAFISLLRKIAEASTL